MIRHLRLGKIPLSKPLPEAERGFKTPLPSQGRGVGGLGLCANLKPYNVFRRCLLIMASFPMT